MKIELKAFQEIAAARLRDELDFAQAEALRGRPQAIILSSPTGSGKTVTITALMERIYEGYESHPPDRDAVFLWLSDAPELNAQSRDKILVQSSIFEAHDLVTVESSFSREQFESGKVYFLNTQKLSKDHHLTKTGDGRDYTIWQTVENTNVAKPSNFYLIIDEAHRGMLEKRGERKRATSIAQRFIKGYPEGGMRPVNLIIGMSATPDRFNNLIEGMDRTRRPVQIATSDVKVSGLLKDRIALFYPQEKQHADWTLLEEATRRWKKFSKAWRKYCEDQGMEHVVEPVLVIQVENALGKQLTRTNLSELVGVVQRVAGKLSERAWGHAFQEDSAIAADGLMIRKIEASKIESDPDVKVVLFKMSLTTGWDCPRAEVMMSFRKAVDSTLIAQLVGRMVRTPLARSIEGQDFLNTVSLYLPHYDRASLEAILGKLNNPDPDIGPGVETEDGSKLIQYVRDPKKAELFAKLEKLPSYIVDRITKSSNVRRLMKLARLLTFDEINVGELDKAKKLIVKSLSGELSRLMRQKGFIGNVAANKEIDVREVWVEYGEWKELEASKTNKVRATPENIQDLFEDSGRKLGEGLHMDFWRSRKSELGDPSLAKLQLFGILQEKPSWQRLENLCGEQIDRLFARYWGKIGELPSAKQENYKRIKRSAKHPEPETLLLPPDIETREEKPLWERHLYADKKGKFGAKFNKWEMKVLEQELGKSEVLGWLRNIPRKPWAFCVPYQMHGEYRPLYPDLLIFRKEKRKIVADLLDPHDSGLPDAVEKAKGLAIYARDHGTQFGRIELILLTPSDEIWRLDLNKESIRNKILKLSGKDHLDQLFEDSN